MRKFVLTTALVRRCTVDQVASPFTPDLRKVQDQNTLNRQKSVDRLPAPVLLIFVSSPNTAATVEI
jgi:hypothetical protein